jgi:hypothetical protein
VLETPREREEAGGSCGGSREVTVAVVDHAVGGLSFDLFWELRTLLSHRGGGGGVGGGGGGRGGGGGGGGGARPGGRGG